VNKKPACFYCDTSDFTIIYL